jgi:hypothetical protein
MILLLADGIAYQKTQDLLDTTGHAVLLDEILNAITSGGCRRY